MSCFAMSMPLVMNGKPGLSPDTCANIIVSAAYCTTFQLFAVSMSCERWLRIALSLSPVTLNVIE